METGHSGGINTDNVQGSFVTFSENGTYKVDLIRN